MFKFFVDNYLTTTNPKLNNYEFFNIYNLFNILIVIIFHIIIYVSFFNMINYIFNNRLLNNSINNRLILILFIIMLFGFIGRFYHSKAIYKSFNYDIKKTREFIDTHYNNWLFIG
jgi:hypothetical protein